MRPSRLSALFAALCLVLVASCVDGGVPMAPDGLTGGAVLPISAAALPQAVDGVPPAINRIRAVARVVPGGTVVGSAVLDVNPSADSWAVEIKIDLGGFPSTTVEVT